MPIYEYVCKNDECQHVFEIMYTSFGAAKKDEAAEECPKCSSKEKERLMNKNTSFTLKGKGWAKDGYK